MHVTTDTTTHTGTRAGTRPGAAPHVDLADVRRRIKAIFIGSVGNLVEWYDFYVYAAFALYFAHAFFPGGDPVVQQLNAAILFAIGFIVRPIGGWLFGHMADRYGRRNALMLSVLLMSLRDRSARVVAPALPLGGIAPPSASAFLPIGLGRAIAQLEINATRLMEEDMRTLPAIALILAGSLLGSLAPAGTADAHKAQRYYQPRHTYQPHYYQPRGYYYRAPSTYSWERQVCEERAQAADPTGQYAGYPCWAREAFGRSPGGRR